MSILLRAIPPLLAASLVGCGPSATPGPTKAEASAAKAGAEEGGAAAGEEEAPKPADGPAAGGKARFAVKEAGPGPDLNLRDPSWFKATIFEGATLVKQGRSPADDDGLFASQITLQLADGTTVEACVEHLSEVVGADVPNLAVKDEGDRTSINGTTDHYSVTLLCGEAKGKMTAYVSYRWTSLPAAGG
jgi:hypothetical protein